MKVAIRADGAPVSGRGHVSRCLALADALKMRGAEVDMLETPQAEESWLESSGATDWIVVDHYRIDATRERTFRSKARRVLVIDDLADRAHDCDVLLDQNLVAGMETRYAGRVPDRCRLLLGPEYALLHPIYAELHDRVSPRGGPVRRILVFVSGADTANLTGRIVEAVQSLRRPDIDVDVVIAAGSPHASALGASIAAHPNIHLHSGPPTLAPLMADADLAVGAAGVATWERLCLGLPAIVITIAANQRPIAARLHDEGLVRWLGEQDTVTSAAIAQALQGVVDTGLDDDWSSRCLVVVDGRGAERVCAAMQ